MIDPLSSPPHPIQTVMIDPLSSHPIPSWHGWLIPCLPHPIPSWHGWLIPCLPHPIPSWHGWLIPCLPHHILSWHGWLILSSHPIPSWHGWLIPCLPHPMPTRMVDLVFPPHPILRRMIDPLSSQPHPILTRMIDLLSWHWVAVMITPASATMLFVYPDLTQLGPVNWVGAEALVGATPQGAQHLITGLPWQCKWMCLHDHSLLLSVPKGQLGSEAQESAASRDRLLEWGLAEGWIKHAVSVIHGMDIKVVI